MCSFNKGIDDCLTSDSPSLKFYQEAFEKQFLEETETFYNRESAEFLLGHQVENQLHFWVTTNSGFRFCCKGGTHSALFFQF